MASITLSAGGLGFSFDIMRCSSGRRQARSMCSETYIFWPLSHGTKYSSTAFMGRLLGCGMLPAFRQPDDARIWADVLGGGRDGVQDPRLSTPDRRRHHKYGISPVNR